MFRALFSPLRRLSGRSARQNFRYILFAGGVFGTGYIVTQMNEVHLHYPTAKLPALVHCATKHVPQSSVINSLKDHALYLTIHLTPGASVAECLKAVGRIQQHVDTISPPDLVDESDEIWFGVGLGPDFLDRLKPDDKPSGVVPYPYRTRVGPLGDLPNTGGDIFIHAKCNERGRLFQLCQAVIHNMPLGSVAKFEDVYGWIYRGGRDLSGFIDGTENPAAEEDRIAAAIDPKSGGSYVVTQKWVHNHGVIRSTKDSVKEQWIGRDISDSTELRKKPNTSHVARMVGSPELDAPAKFQIVRHSQPWGTVSGESGLFFIAYSATPVALDWMLDRMTGLSEDKQSDDVMRFTSCVTGNYWYFPSKSEFDRLTKSASSGGFSRYWR